MAKIKSAVTAERLQSARSRDEKRWLLLYGKGADTAGGKVVVDFANCQRRLALDRSLLTTAAPKSVDYWKRELHMRELELERAKLNFCVESLEAIIQGNANFFREVADAVAVLARTKGDPLQKYQVEIVIMFESCEKACNRAPTVQEMVEVLRGLYPELDDDHKANLEREVRRWCKELGLEPSKPTKASSARTGKHWRRVWKRGGHQPPGWAEAVLLEAAYGLKK